MEEMAKLRLAVVSDLHVGKGCRAKDLCPHPESAHLDANFLEGFVKFADRQKLRADYLLVPGDITHTADAAEVSLAATAVARIARALGVKKKNILFVPGNHDVDWARHKPDDSPETRRELKFMNLRAPKLMGNCISKTKHIALLGNPHYSLWTDDRVVIVGYNSASHDEPTSTPHHGLVVQEHLAELRATLDGASLGPDRIKVFLVHHHPVQYSDPVPNEPDFSAMTNAQNLLELLRAHRFDFLVHGHKHAPRFQTSIINGAFPLAILAAGSFSARLDERWSGYVNNQFHIITIDERSPSDQVAKGAVVTWAYTILEGWHASNDRSGMPHQMPFGTYTTPAVLSMTLEPTLRRFLDERDFIEWKDVTSVHPELRHLPVARATEVLRTLGPTVGFEVRGLSPSEFIILKT